MWFLIRLFNDVSYSFFFRWGFVIDDVIDVDTTFALPNHGSFITGSTFSIHDQHIERLWHDVFVGCLYIYMYYSLFGGRWLFGCGK